MFYIFYLLFILASSMHPSPLVLAKHGVLLVYLLMLTRLINKRDCLLNLVLKSSSELRWLQSVIIYLEAVCFCEVELFERFFCAILRVNFIRKPRKKTSENPL